LGISPLGSLGVRFHACVLYLTPCDNCSRSDNCIA